VASLNALTRCGGSKVLRVRKDRETVKEARSRSLPNPLWRTEDGVESLLSREIYVESTSAGSKMLISGLSYGEGFTELATGIDVFTGCGDLPR